MKMINLFITVLLLSGCSFSPVEMAPEPTIQKYDLSDPESDGVISARDKCPETSSGANINNDGCGVEVIEKIRRQLLINFDSASDVVASEYYPEIKSLADFIKANPAVRVTIEGHTSILGDRAYNKKLSLRRAEAIKYILVNNYNIDAKRVKSIGYGSERLLLKGNDEYSHAKNRRIVVEIVGERKSTDMKWTIYSVDQPK
jgi:outer membrane protein OmpA-like peptidoglycan-associated protein